MKRMVLFALAISASACLAKTEVYQVGDWFVKNEAGNGKVLIADAQRRIGKLAFDDLVVFLHARASCPAVTREVSADLAARPSAQAVRDLGATLALFVKDDPADVNAILVAPDSRWVVVNVAALAEAGDTEKALSFRVYKAMVRAVLQLCGAGGDSMKGSLMGPMFGPKDYDACREVAISPMVIGLLQTYVEAAGINLVQTCTYEGACEGGWAPKPVTDEQKAIWNEVHAPPTKPLKITYDKAAQKPVVK